MTFVRLAHFPGGTRAQYDALAAELLGAEVPRTRRAFAAGPVAGGWQVVQVWDRRADLDAFNERWFLPALERVPRELRLPVPAVTDFEAEVVDIAPAGGQPAAP